PVPGDAGRRRGPRQRGDGGGQDHWHAGQPGGRQGHRPAAPGGPGDRPAGRRRHAPHRPSPAGAAVMTDERHRCGWPGTDPLYMAYHDTEWGVPERDDRALFEKLILDGFQAGLAWITILRKRENFRHAFDGFDPVTISRYGEADIARLLGDAGIIRHRGKIEATIGNAVAWRRIMERDGGFSAFLWQFTGGEPLHNAWPDWHAVPAQTAE